MACYSMRNPWIRDLRKKIAFSLEAAENLSNEVHVKSEQSLLNMVYQIFCEVNWIVLISSETAPFLTCDRPVVLVQNGILFPLNKQFALYGANACVDKPTEMLTEDKVAKFNSFIIQSAISKIYAPSKHFSFVDSRNGGIKNGEHLL